MKITIEPTSKQTSLSPECCHLSVSVLHPFDDLTCGQFVELFHAAAIAFGYQPESLSSALAEFKGD